MIRRRRTVWTAALAVAVLLVGALPAGGAGPAGPDPCGAARRKIVVVHTALNEATREAVVTGAGGAVLKHLPLVEGAAVWLPDAAAEQALEGHPGVVQVEPDLVLRAVGKTPPPQPPRVLPWGVDRIDANLAWASSTGSGVKVAVLDTGFDLSHPDLSANIAGGYNALNRNRPPKDGNGHGTHVAGTIAAVNNFIGVAGVAPAARLYAVKVLSDSGWGWLSDIIEGIDWSIRNGMQVINMSLGSSTDSQALHDAVIAAHDAGISIVAAAGNDGPADNTVNYQARYPEVTAVAATDRTDTLASFSSRGPEVDLTAPGANVYSTYKGGTYAAMSGTSMAAPHVAGTAALVLQVNPGLSPDAVRSPLLNTAEPVTGSPYPLVDAQAAVAALTPVP